MIRDVIVPPEATVFTNTASLLEVITTTVTDTLSIMNQYMKAARKPPSPSVSPPPQYVGMYLMHTQ